MESQTINPYVEKIFGEWFKRVILTSLLIPTIFLSIYGVVHKWIDQTFAIELLFLLLGIFIGRLFEDGKGR